MIKDKLMDALKSAAAEYNGGMGANVAVAKAAESADFNEKQAERLVEMFNTLAALNKEKDKSDPAGSCELASKEAVAKILMDGCGSKKEASAPGVDYSFYGSSPKRTNGTIEARNAGMSSMTKAASPDVERTPPELDVSQRSLYKIIEGKIDLLKSAAASADEVVRNLRIESERIAVKIAKAIEDPFANPSLADMFKAACVHKGALEAVSGYSTKVAESDGGVFAKANVFDSSAVDNLLKFAQEIEENLSQVGEYERKRDFYEKKASEFHNEMLEAVGLAREHKEGAGTLAGMFRGVKKTAEAPVGGVVDQEKGGQNGGSDVDMCVKIAELIRKTGVSADEVARLAEDFEKDAAPKMLVNVPIPSLEESRSALVTRKGIDGEKSRILNVRRSVLLADLMSNDPIIRDADPNVVVEAYKTMVMTSPRVSLDKAQVRSFLRSSVNSVAISPSDAKVIADVDKGVRISNVDRLTAADSSIKDSNLS